jgi:hypothetical protein
LKTRPPPLSRTAGLQTNPKTNPTDSQGIREARLAARAELLSAATRRNHFPELTKPA